MGSCMCSCRCTSKVEPTTSSDRRRTAVSQASRSSIARVSLVYSSQERELIRSFLQDFDVASKATIAHQELVAWHWSKVFQDLDDPMNANGRKIVLMLCKSFYDYIEQHSPEVEATFSSSMSVRGRVLAHITAGMYPLLHAPPHVLTEHIMRLTTTHLHVGVRPEHFNPMGQALIHAIATVSGEVYWSPSIEAAWRHMFCQCSVLLLASQIAAQHPGPQPEAKKEDQSFSPTIADLGSASNDTVPSVQVPKKSSFRRMRRARTTPKLQPVRELLEL